MMTLEQIIEKLDDKNLTQVAKNVGLSPQTLWRIKNRVTGDNVSYETVKTLSDYLEEGAVTA